MGEEKRKILNDVYNKLIITYFDCDEHVGHDIIKKSLDEIIILMGKVINKNE